MDWQAARISFLLAALSAALLLPVGLALARWLATTDNRFRALVEALLILPLLLPPTVVGFYMLSLFGQNTPVGAWLAQSLGLQLVFSFEGLLLASLLINVPFMVQPIQRAFAGVAPSVREAAWVSGMSTWRTFTTIELPLIWPGLVGGMVLTAAHTLGEFGVVLMLGGAIPGQTQTLSIAIYDRVQAFDDAAAHSMAAILVVCSLGALVAVLGLQHRFTSAKSSSSAPTP